MDANSSNIYDVGIIGAGAAGLTASIFASRYELSNIVLGTLWGGEIANASVIENYPGFTTISGAELTQKMVEHAKHFGATLSQDKVLKVQARDGEFDLVTEGGEKIAVRTVILATGTSRRHLNVPGEEKLAGRGVSYCATCDAAFFRDKETVVVGGGDTAMTAALHVAQFSPTVHLLVRGAELGGEPIWRSQVHSHNRIKVLYQTEVLEIRGEGKVEGVLLSRPHDGKDELPVEGVFVEIGADPEVEIARDLGVELDQDGYIDVSQEMETNISGVFAAGDATNANAHIDQIISAEAEGALAARSAFRLLTEEEMKTKGNFLQKIFKLS